MLARIPTHLIPIVRRKLTQKYGVDVTIQELTYYNWSMSKKHIVPKKKVPIAEPKPMNVDKTTKIEAKYFDNIFM